MEEIRMIFINIFKIICKRYVMLFILLYPLYLNGIVLGYVLIPDMVIKQEDSFLSPTPETSVIIVGYLVLGFMVFSPIFFHLYKMTKIKGIKFYLTLSVISLVAGIVLSMAFEFIV